MKNRNFIGLVILTVIIIVTFSSCKKVYTVKYTKSNDSIEMQEPVGAYSNSEAISIVKRRHTKRIVVDSINVKSCNIVEY